MTTVSAVREDWMVETEGTELPTPHAVIEPVSDTRVRNGNFRCRDGSAKSAVPPLRDRYRDALRVPSEMRLEFVWRILREHEGIVSGGKVNRLIDGLCGERLPTIPITLPKGPTAQGCYGRAGCK